MTDYQRLESMHVMLWEIMRHTSCGPESDCIGATVRELLIHVETLREKKEVRQ